VKTRLPILVALLFGLLGLDGEALPGQIPEMLGPVTTQIAPPMRVPFGPGEHLTYKLKLGIFSVGEGHMQVMGLDSVRGELTYHTSFRMGGGIPGYRVRYDYQSWFGVTDLVSHRFIKDQEEGGNAAFRHYEFYPEERCFERADIEAVRDMPTDQPLDDVAFLYFVRSLPLEVGKEYRFDRYFREGGNPVVLRVLRIETIEVPAGRFETIVVRPIIQTRGLFSQGGEAELYFTNDERRLLVHMKSKVPLVGSLTLHLKSITEGHPLRSPSGTPQDDPPTPAADSSPFTTP
jgi:hypothetical protein